MFLVVKIHDLYICCHTIMTAEIRRVGGLRFRLNVTEALNPSSPSLEKRLTPLIIRTSRFSFLSQLGGKSNIYIHLCCVLLCNLLVKYVTKFVVLQFVNTNKGNFQKIDLSCCTDII